MAWQNQDLDELFRKYRGRAPSQRERETYGNAPRDRLMGDLYAGYDPTEQWAQSFDDLRKQAPAWEGLDEKALDELTEAEYGKYYKELEDYLTAEFGDRQKAHDMAMRYLEEDRGRGTTRLGEDRTRGIGRLTETRDTSLGRLAEDYGTNLDSLRRNINARGLYYSGERGKQEGLLERGRSRSESDIRQRHTRGSEDIERGYTRGSEDVGRQYTRGREGEDLSWGGTQRGYERGQKDLERQRKYDYERFKEGERTRKRQQYYDQYGYGVGID